MQVARNYFLTLERTFMRKFNEILLAIEIERRLTKEEIFELYVNRVFLGHRAYGFEAAAQVYYGQSIGELTLAQHAMLAGIPKAPSRNNPLSGPGGGQGATQLDSRAHAAPRLHRHATPCAAVPRRRSPRPARGAGRPSMPSLRRGDGAAADAVALRHVAYTAGYSVYTTLDSRSAAGGPAGGGRRPDPHLRQRHGYRGPERSSRRPEGRRHCPGALARQVLADTPVRSPACRRRSSRRGRRGRDLLLAG
jgi:penicillin-binding protein 1A